MRRQSTREQLLIATLFTAVVSVVSVLFGGAEAVQAALTAPILFAVMFVTMRVTNRLARTALGRFRPPAPAPERRPAPEANSERPDHAQRRRQRRRRRGRR